MAELNSVQDKLQQVRLLESDQSKKAAGAMAGRAPDAQESSKAREILLDIFCDWIYPAALRTIVQLDVPQILASHATKDDIARMTAEEIVQHMPDATCPSPLNLERLLRVLTTKGIFAEHVFKNDIAEGDNNITRVVRKFSLTWLSRYLVHSAQGTLRNSALLLTLSPEFAASLEFIGIFAEHVFIADAHGDNKITRVVRKFSLTWLSRYLVPGGQGRGVEVRGTVRQGEREHLFDWMKSHPSTANNFKAAFTNTAIRFLPLILSQYHGFESVRKLMDVGGSSGMMLAGIVEKYPHIQAVNFDLPEVVANNPSLPGVEQVGGNMFENVPSGCDAIFMKSILHDWSDEQGVKILKNCYAALPSERGKVIILEQLMPVETPVHDAEGALPFRTDILMLVHCEKGRERTALEFEELTEKAGFTSFQVVAQVGIYWAMEAHK